MKCLERNQQKFYYSLYGATEGKDEYGNDVKGYGDAIEFKANISPSTGTTQVEQFGKEVEYDKVIVTSDTSCPINEESALFIDKEPSFSDDGKPLNDYVVKRVAKSLNSISYAISKVNVS